MPSGHDPMTAAQARLTGRDIVIVCVLGTVTFSGPLAIHFFLPAVPLLKQEFGVGSSMAQAAFSITLFVMALSTLVYGSLADRFGRRVVLIGGLGLFVAGSAVCAMSETIASLIVGRLVQAVGAGCGLVLSRAIAHDLYAGERVVRILAYLTMAYSLGPMIAPPVGGFLVDGIGWRAIFAVAAVAATVTLALALVVLPGDDRRQMTTRLQRGSLLGGYVRLFGNARFCGFVFQSGFGSGAFFAYAGASTLLMNELLHRPPSEFGVYFVLFPIGYWLGTLIASRLGGRVAIEVMVAAGAGVTFLAAVALAGFVLSGALTPLVLFLPGLFVTLGQGLSLPNAQAGAIGTVPALAGTAAGIGIFLQLGLGAAGAQLTGLFADGTAWPMIAVVLGSTILEVIAGLVPLMLRGRKRRSDR
jgi:DHA1 family bicyclomycin/chloramphenicol resistance-like MFS transporter